MVIGRYIGEEPVYFSNTIGVQYIYIYRYDVVAIVCLSPQKLLSSNFVGLSCPNHIMLKGEAVC